MIPWTRDEVPTALAAARCARRHGRVLFRKLTGRRAELGRRTELRYRGNVSIRPAGPD